jgi:hypothetical protein
MRRRYAALFMLVALLTATSFLPITARADKPAAPSEEELADMAQDLGMDPATCDAIQARIDQVVAVYQSSQTESEKLAKLTELWSQAMTDMKKAGEQDGDVASTSGQYLLIMQELVDMAKAAPDGGQQVSPAAKNTLVKLKALTQNYVKMMKIMCPKLSLPPLMNQ